MKQQGESHVQREAASFAAQGNLRFMRCHQNREMLGMTLYPSASRGSQPCLTFRLLAFEFSELWENKFLLSHPACSSLLQQPQEVNTSSIIYHVSTILLADSHCKGNTILKDQIWAFPGGSVG